MPKPTNLLTDWMTIGTAGPTVDGRTIKDSWLEEMAATYDPEEYTAVINYEHIFGNLGSIRELRTAKDRKERTVLQGRIRPNWDYMIQNTTARKLFTSMEIMHNFAKTGKCYLTGLAATDKPASLGTTEIHFSVENGREEGFSRSEPMEFSLNIPGPEKPAADFPADEKTFLSMLKSLFASKQTNEDEDMTPEELQKAIENGNKPLRDELSTLKTQVETLETRLAKEPGGEGDDTDGKEKKTSLKKKPAKAGKTGEEAGDDDPGGETTDLSTLQAAVDGLKGSIDTLGENLAKALEGKTSLQTGGDTGPAGDGDKEFI